MSSLPATARALSPILFVMLGFACLPTVFLGIEWFVATLTLGHPPVPSIDDPKSISLPCGMMHLLTTGVLFISIPAQIYAAVVGIKPHRSTPSVIILSFSLIFLSLGAFALFFGATPDELIAWWLD